MIKRPSFQFYPGDWLRDTALRSCSIGARGLWMDMLCLMHEGYPYGYLKVGNKVILAPNLARMVGATLQETEGWLYELENANVFSKDEENCIYSRRMIRDEKVRAARAAGGVLGGNPALKTRSPEVGSKVNLRANLQPTPSSSSASSSADNKKENNKRKKTVDPLVKAQAVEVLSFLNLKTERNYRPVNTNLDFIIARLESGVAVQDCKSIIAKKIREWKNNPKNPGMDLYLRPATLFNKTKFEQYLGELLREQQL